MCSPHFALHNESSLILSQIANSTIAALFTECVCIHFPSPAVSMALRRETRIPPYTKDTHSCQWMHSTWLLVDIKWEVDVKSDFLFWDYQPTNNNIL